MKSLNVDLNLLTILVALYDTRSVTLAAQKLNMSQSAASKALSRLRRNLGDQLFIKTSAGMEPTARTSSMIGPIRSVLSCLQRDVLAGADFNPESTKTTFTLALSEVGELLILPVMIKALQQVARHSSINSIGPTSVKLSDALEYGKVDLAIGVFPDLRTNSFFRQRISLRHPVCLIRADHPMKKDRFTLKQYVALRHVMVGAGHSQEMIQRVLGDRKLPRVELVTSHYSIIPEVVKSTDLVATLLPSLANYFARIHANLQLVAAPREIPTIEISQYWHRKYSDDSRNKWLRGLVKETLIPQKNENHDA